MRNVMEVLDTANDEGQIDDPMEEIDEDEDNDSDTDANVNCEKKDASSKDKSRRKLHPHTNDDSSDSDSGAGTSSKPFHHNPSAVATAPLSGAAKIATHLLDVNGHNDANDGERGVRAQVRDYKDHHKQLHRKHRGVMQWKGARTVDWMVKKVKGAEGLGDRIVGRDKDGDKAGGGVETEV